MKSYTRRNFLQTFGAGAGLLSLSQLRCFPQGSGKCPNIILFLTDDQRWDDVGYNGNGVIQTENIDKLAREGVVFENAFVTSSVCAASRASIFTGQTERLHGCNFYRTNTITIKSMDKDVWDKSYPALLRSAGYRTGFIGKFGIIVEGYENGMPHDCFDVWNGFPGQGKYFPEGKDGIHMTELMGNQAVEFLNGCSKEKPFCLSISFKSPHSPMQPDPAYSDLYKDAVIPLRGTEDDSYFQKLPSAYHKKVEFSRKDWNQNYCTFEKRQRTIKDRYRLITGVDAVIGKINNELKNLEFDKDTIIIFTSDNGFYYGEHGLAQKYYLHEESIRVPLLIYDPRMPESNRRTKINEMTANIDIAPTILSLAGVAVPEVVQGKDLYSLVNKKADSWRKDLLFEHLLDIRGPLCDGVRTEKWKYICLFEENPIQEELYDIEKDPLEKNNLAGDEKYKEILMVLRKRLEEMRKEYSSDNSI